METLKTLTKVLGVSIVGVIIGIIIVMFAGNIGYLLGSKSDQMFTAEDKYVNGVNETDGLTKFYEAAVANTENNIKYIKTATNIVGTVITFISLVILISVLFGKNGIMKQLKSLGNDGKDSF